MKIMTKIASTFFRYTGAQVMLNFVPLCLCAFIFSSCSKSTNPDEGITISGTVTLEGRSDYSGVQIRLYAPVVIDTALTNLNDNYPNYGIELDQQTEFYWREQQPAYVTVTTADGSWKIQHANNKSYHIVAEADSFGWKIVYAAAAGSYAITLKKAIYLSGSQQALNIPEGSFVKITGNTGFPMGSELSVGGGTIIEFEGDYDLSCRSTVTFSQAAGKRTIILAEQSGNHANIRLQDCGNVVLEGINFHNIGDGLYISNCTYVIMRNNRFSRSIYAAEFFNCTYIQIENNFLSDLSTGLQTGTCGGSISENIITAISGTAINSVTDQNLTILHNVIKNCIGTGLSINQALVNVRSHVSIENNFFINNNLHIDLGILAFCTAHQNNFLASTGYAVNAAYSTDIDTLDFKNNYWNTSNPLEIQTRINDYTDNPLGQFIGYIIDYSGYLSMYVNP